MSTNTLMEHLYKDVELAYWDEASEEHIIYTGRLIDIEDRCQCITIKNNNDIIILDISKIDQLFFN